MNRNRIEMNIQIPIALSSVAAQLSSGDHGTETLIHIGGILITDSVLQEYKMEQMLQFSTPTQCTVNTFIIVEFISTTPLINRTTFVSPLKRIFMVVP